MNFDFRQMKEISNKRLKELYGNNIEQAILERYNAEMEIVCNQKWENVFMVAHLITKKMKKDNQIINLTGCASALFINYLLEISNINPIDYNIPYETFIGIKGENTPAFELVVNWKYLIGPLKKYVEKLLGKEKVIVSALTNYIKLELLMKDNIKISIIAGDFPTPLRYLEEITGIKYHEINLDNNEILKLLEMEDISSTLGFQSKTSKQIFTDISPKNIEHLVKVYNLFHGTGIWDNNVENLIKTHNINELPCSRDDIFLYLTSKGIDKEVAYNIMEFIGKGRHLRDTVTFEKYTEVMIKYNIPEWYIKSLEKIKYMFPMSHTYNVIMQNLYIAWYKLHYLREYEQVMKVLCLKANIEKTDLNYEYLEQSKEEKIITFEEVKDRLKNKSLKNYTDEDILDRYIAYGTEEELNTPEIQKALLEHGYISELLEMTNFITDKQVISDILHKYLPKIEPTILIFGQAKDMWVIEHLQNPKERKLSFEFIDNDTNEKTVLEGPTIFTQEEYDKYRNQFYKYQNNLIAIVREKNKKYKLLCFLVNIFKTYN